MSVNDALEFYGSVQNALRSKLAPKIGEQAKQLFEDKFKVSLPENAVASLTESVGIPYADDQPFRGTGLMPISMAPPKTITTMAQ